MNKIIRILSYNLNLSRDGGVLRYKIIYLRDYYPNYNIDDGDEIDTEIFNYFSQKGYTQLFWEYASLYNGQDISSSINGYCPKNIPLTIAAKIEVSSLTTYELDNLQNSGQSFPDQNKLVTLYYRCNVNEQHPNWVLLPTSIRISIDYKIYIHLAKTIYPFV
ncbi:MAG: hypothetical protein IPM51_07205 [Sphingobacteriaceae bacterium]|nr:hypothetical protein [Sphingobacteriaceae bacterium]